MSSVLDAGAARYSSILPWLRLYGFEHLVGNNLEFGLPVRRGPVMFEYGDITSMPYAAHEFDAVTYMSVIEHGVSLQEFFSSLDARRVRFHFHSPHL
ncbi:MAG: hypothetical protein ACRCTR_02075 [Actinomycetota bacterium]